MMTINEMRVRRGEIWEQAKNFLDTHRNDSGILSAEDTATYERMEQDIVDLGHEIERQERLESFEREMKKATSEPIRNTPQAELPTATRTLFGVLSATKQAMKFATHFVKV